jgi:sortase (surface protein transpeptidase)
MLTGLAPALPAVLPWAGPTASQEALFRSFGLTRVSAVPPPLEAPRQAIPPLKAARSTEVTRVADPTHIMIPDIGVDADVVPLGLQPDGSLEVPKDFSKAGWYQSGPEPGEPGPATIIGHFDSPRAPAVFFRLRDLTPGNVILVETADGEGVWFEVDRVQEYPKSAFPTAAVYGPTASPELRLITCGGTFDRSVHSYRDNVIVFATFIAVTRPDQPST